jgi:hypothetical protein
MILHTMKFLVEHRVIPVNQYGFMPGKSITSNRLYCLFDWTKLLDLGRSLDVVYFDFAKAFDRLPIKLLLFKLQHIGIRGNLFYWLDAFLSDRTFRVKVGGVLSASGNVILKWSSTGVRTRSVIVYSLHGRRQIQCKIVMGHVCDMNI